MNQNVCLKLKEEHNCLSGINFKTLFGLTLSANFEVDIFISETI